ncbi:hypothetical protein HF324_23200 [Chitinophaga oryzae]|uniref:PBCV-specific basic adaptor domain-containing protein n=1 Tax=Chitinophaga oryzae TaxID=2725414 RepID=A0AAE6ZIW2_9BACT|nr:hypothetical protein [Chitinophaga oryzae]QJB34056.1 hypothetical protein HF329_23300 [Chitinophaga oryzae]QJB40584.1 hypothetical protein HF324_23200 [Chitinophaga oryzae]
MRAPKTISAALFALAFGAVATLPAQAVFAQNKLDSTAKKVGNKTASIAVKGASAITDKVYKGKEGPNGETVYINRKDQKYIVDEKGKKVYLKPSQIHNKKE